MAGIIVLEDGSDIYASNMGLGGALGSIGEALLLDEPELAAWLLDVSERPGGCMDFDLRGLSMTHRDAFWRGVVAANDRYREWDQETAFSPSVDAIRLFYGRYLSRLCPTENADVAQIDLTILWGV